MNRRELIRHITLITGAAFAGGEFFLSGCSTTERKPDMHFSENDIFFFDEVAETIIPKTNTPGAKDAGVGKFIAKYSVDCYNEDQLMAITKGISQLNDVAVARSGKKFTDITSQQKKDLLIQIDLEAKEYNAALKKGQTSHYFTLMKQLTLFGFFTSKEGASQVLRYRPVPGKYEGCIDYIPGETSWA